MPGATSALLATMQWYINGSIVSSGSADKPKGFGARKPPMSQPKGRSTKRNKTKPTNDQVCPTHCAAHASLPLHSKNLPPQCNSPRANHGRRPSTLQLRRVGELTMSRHAYAYQHPAVSCFYALSQYCSLTVVTPLSALYHHSTSNTSFHSNYENLPQVKDWGKGEPEDLGQLEIDPSQPVEQGFSADGPLYDVLGHTLQQLQVRVESSHPPSVA